jgi:diketogulonate reductase-like aldo/keto reductase
MLYRSTFEVAAAQRSLEQSLRELGTEYIDLLLLHDPEPSLLKSDQVYELLERARISGKIRAWGVAGEPETATAVIEELPGPTLVVQIRDDIFRRDEVLNLRDQSNYLITFGVLGFAVPRVLAHVTANGERTRKWSEAVGADCANPHTIATFLLKDAMRANTNGTVLYSTTRPERLRDAAALFVSDPTQPDTSLEVFRQLVRSEMRTSSATTKDDQ